MENKQPKTLADFMTSVEMSDLILNQTREISDHVREGVKVRSYLLDNFGPFGRKSKILTGEEDTVDMVKMVIQSIQNKPK